METMKTEKTTETVLRELDEIKRVIITYSTVHPEVEITIKATIKDIPLDVLQQVATELDIKLWEPSEHADHFYAFTYVGEHTIEFRTKKVKTVTTWEEVA